MRSREKRETRILAIDPTTQGFGFVVLEGPETLVDWGVAHVRTEKTLRTLERVADLLDHYAPDLLVLEDAEAAGSRRRERARKLLQKTAELASRRRVRVKRVPMKAVKKAFAQESVRTKPEIAAAIARRFPELASRLPPRRKPWMSEDERMAIFDAAALALTPLLGRRHDRSRDVRE